MTEKGKVVIFRCTKEGDDESNITTDKIEFEGNAEIPDNRSKIQQFTQEPLREAPDNPVPLQDESRKVDVGFQGSIYTINAFFLEEIGRAAGIAKLRDWLREPQEIDNAFREGRFGIRNDYRPEYNLIPDDTAGFKLTSAPITQSLKFSSHIFCPIKLTFSGDPIRLGL